MGLLDKITKKKELLDEITELRRQVRKLRADAASNKGAMRSIAGLEEKVIQLDEEDRIEYVNSTLARAFGVDREALLGSPLSDLDNFSWGPGIMREAVAEARGNGRAVVREVQYVDPKENKEVYLRLKVTVDNNRPQILIEDLSDLRNIQQNFRRFVSPAVISKMAELARDYFKAERKVMTVLFADLRGFTSASESLAPEQVRNLINEYLSVHMDIIDRHEATLDKVVGDEVMALFGAPIPNDDHAVAALRVALEMQRAQQQLCAKWAEHGMPALQLGIGINTGDMMVGNIGSEQRIQYTVLGHHVNLGHRLVDAAEPGQILISQGTFDAIIGRHADLRSEMRFDVIGRIKAKGISAPVEVIQVSA